MDDKTTNDQLLLSFAIPTYNFGKFISETIRSIQNGAQILSRNQFEIVILDGGSIDNTDEVVQSLRKQYGNIRYVKQQKRGGIDHDMNKVASLAKGEYIWLFSADDQLITGWDRFLLPQLETKPDMVLVPAVLCDIKMQPLRKNPIFKERDGAGAVQYCLNEEPQSLTKYLNRIVTLEALFSFMSAIVVKRSSWNELDVREDYYGSCWAHCARLMPLLFRTTTITYLNEYLILKRGGNDSFMENGFVARIGIAIEGWLRIIQEFFDNEEQRKILCDALRRDMPILLFIYAKITAYNKTEIERLKLLALQLYSVPNLPWTIRLLYMVFRIMPASPVLNKIADPLLPTAIKIRHKIKAVLRR